MKLFLTRDAITRDGGILFTYVRGCCRGGPGDILFATTREWAYRNFNVDGEGEIRVVDWLTERERKRASLISV